MKMYKELILIDAAFNTDIEIIRRKPFYCERIVSERVIGKQSVVSELSASDFSVYKISVNDLSHNHCIICTLNRRLKNCQLTDCIFNTKLDRKTLIVDIDRKTC